jgi:hypothetical protein
MVEYGVGNIAVRYIELGMKGGKGTLAILVSVVSKIYVRWGCGGRDGRVPCAGNLKVPKCEIFDPFFYTNKSYMGR